MSDTSTIKINKIFKKSYEGKVYNLELESESDEDDLFWVDQNTGIVTHNCLPKDLSALIEFSKSVGYNPNFLEEVQESNARIGRMRQHQ
tara:strand:+ start:3137 stop:3403 length:267 start_codon:yes stop_codon:yes gene_type:complete